MNINKHGAACLGMLFFTWPLLWMKQCGLYLTASIHQSVGNLLQFHTQHVLEEYYLVMLKSRSLEVFLAVSPSEHQVIE